MTTGSWDRGNGVLPSDTKVSIFWKRAWSGEDSILKIDVPNTFGYGSKQVAVIKPPVSQTGKSNINVFQVVAEAVKLREELHLGDPQPQRIPRGFTGRRLDGSAVLVPKRATFNENSYSMNEMMRVDVPCFTKNFYQGPQPPSRFDEGYYSPGYGPAMVSYGAIDWAAMVLLDSNDQIKLVTRLREKMQGTDFNMSVALGEGSKALSMISVAATRVSGALLSLKRGRVKDAFEHLFRTPQSKSFDPTTLPGFVTVNASVNSTVRKALRVERDLFLTEKKGILDQLSKRDRKRALEHEWRLRRLAYLQRLDLSAYTPKQFSSWWLEAVYGWLPLVNDMKEGAEFLAHQLNVPFAQSYRAAVRKELNLTRVTSGPGYGVTITSYGKSTRTHRRGLIARIAEKPSVPKLLGLTSLESVIWELVPWSFVVDWVIPIGDWLTARGHAQGLTGTFITSDKQTGIAYAPTGNLTLIGGVQPYYSNVIFSRVITFTLAVPMPTVKPLSSIPSWIRAANSVALLVTRLVK